MASTHTYNAAKNRLLAADNLTFTYDNEGQLATGYGVSYAFDSEHRLTAIGATASFRYDGIGNRLEATRNGVATRYLYDLNGNLVAEADSSNTITRYYIHGIGLMALATPAGQTYCYHFNQVGNTVALTDMNQAVVNQYAYTPFGEIANQAETIAQPFTFVGQMGVMAEPNGFYYMRARYYDPEVRRFISEDPIGFNGGDLNLYAYVGNNPMMMVDPSGNAAFWYHFSDGYQAGRTMGRGVWDSLKFGWAAMMPDFNLYANVPYAHATTPDVGGDSTKAISDTLAWANSQWNSGTTEGQAAAIHAWRDVESHAGSYFPLNPSVGDYVRHIIEYDLPSSGSFEYAIQPRMSSSVGKLY